jgi:penicillin-insensitive murein DD-endopeptidase
LLWQRKDNKIYIRLHMKKVIYLLFLILFLILIIYFGNDFLILFESNEPSQSIGNVADGKLINGKRLPSSGDNFVTYSRLGSLIGRNGVHHKVRDVILDAFNLIYQKYPEYEYVIGECSWLSGGSMKPHRTHQNGLSVDFMVPVRNHDSEINILPTNIFNKFGYDIEFDSTATNEDYTIDFESLAIHLYYLNESAKKHNVKIKLVIFDPVLQKRLFQTEYGPIVQNQMQFTKTAVWVRHDEHYHVNFDLQ